LVTRSFPGSQLVIPGQASPAGRNRAREAEAPEAWCQIIGPSVLLPGGSQRCKPDVQSIIFVPCVSAPHPQVDECPMVSHNHRQFAWMPPTSRERRWNGQVGQITSTARHNRRGIAQERSLSSPATNRSPLQMPWATHHTCRRPHAGKSTAWVHRLVGEAEPASVKWLLGEAQCAIHISSRHCADGEAVHFVITQ
jgi:hypothetical protein